MSKEYVPVFFEWLDVTQDLSAEEKGNLIDAVVSYASGQEYEHFLTGGCRIAFRFLKGQVDRNNVISDARSKARSGKTDQSKTNDNKKEQTATNFPKEKENKKEKEKEVKEKFARFWAAYPRKESKPEALRNFVKINPDEELLATMLAAIDRWKKTDQWQEDGGRYIPHPSTWLNNKRWEDEPPKKASNSPSKPRANDYTQRDYHEPTESLDDVLNAIAGVGA